MQPWKSLPTIFHPLSGRLRQERGQALVEFAIVLPVLILIILGILYFGRYENYSSQETQLAEQGARWAAVNYAAPSADLQAYVLSQASPELASGSSDVAKAVVYIYYPTGSSNVVGNSVRACLVTTVQLPFMGTSAKIVQSATMRIEQPQTAANWAPGPTTGAPTTTAGAAGCPTS